MVPLFWENNGVILKIEYPVPIKIIFLLYGVPDGPVQLEQPSTYRHTLFLRYNGQPASSYRTGQHLTDKTDYSMGQLDLSWLSSGKILLVCKPTDQSVPSNVSLSISDEACSIFAVRIARGELYHVRNITPETSTGIFVDMALDDTLRTFKLSILYRVAYCVMRHDRVMHHATGYIATDLLCTIFSPT